MDDNEPLAPSTNIPETADGANHAADVRVDRILEYVDESLIKDDPLQAAVGAACGDLLLMQYRLFQLVDKAHQQTPDSLTAITEVMPAMNTFMKLGQQAGQFLQLNLKIKAAKEGCKD